jgi:hypothetical protein
MELPIQKKTQNENNNPIKIVGYGFYDESNDLFSPTDDPSDTAKAIAAVVGLPLLGYGGYKLYKHINKKD